MISERIFNNRNFLIINHRTENFIERNFRWKPERKENTTAAQLFSEVVRLASARIGGIFPAVGAAFTKVQIQIKLSSGGCSQSRIRRIIWFDCKTGNIVRRGEANRRPPSCGLLWHKQNMISIRFHFLFRLLNNVYRLAGDQISAFIKFITRHGTPGCTQKLWKGRRSFFASDAGGS